MKPFGSIYAYIQVHITRESEAHILIFNEETSLETLSLALRARIRTMKRNRIEVTCL